MSIKTELDRLAKRHANAGGVGLQVLNLLGSQAENLLEKLPDTTKDRLEDATLSALDVAMKAAGHSRRALPGPGDWLDRAVTTAMGAAGGAGGLPSALAELPVTTTVLLRTIQAQAERHGFDPARPEIEAACLQVFSAAGPLASDDGADTGFLAARMTLTGATVQGMIRAIAPRLSVVLGQKLAAQTVPVIGAMAGAATNYAYTSYYQAMADVQFGLTRLSLQSDMDRAALTDAVLDRLPNTKG